jgi:hypothetical protein
LSCLSALSASPPRRPRFQPCPAFRRRIPGRSPRGSRERFTALPHRLTVDLLRESSYAMRRNAAPGNIMVRGRFRDRYGSVRGPASNSRPYCDRLLRVR